MAHHPHTKSEIVTAAETEDVDMPQKEVLVGADVDDDEEYSLPEQRKIIHKIDRRLLPVVGLMQAVSFLDRANLANAAIAGMTKELKLGIGNRYVSAERKYMGTF